MLWLRSIVRFIDKVCINKSLIKQSNNKSLNTIKYNKILKLSARLNNQVEKLFFLLCNIKITIKIKKLIVCIHFVFFIENLMIKISPCPDFPDDIVFNEDHVKQENVPHRNQRVMSHIESETRQFACK